MIWKNIYTVLLLLLLTPLVNADLCINSENQKTNCTIITPPLSCAVYDYIILNKTGTILTNDTLTQVNSSVYSFEFNYTDGEYIIKLCDGSVKEISINNGDNMYEIAIVILLVALFFVLIYFANTINTDAAGIMPMIKTTIYAGAVLVIWGIVQTLYEMSLLSGMNLTIPYMLYWASFGLGIIILGMFIIIIFVNGFLYIQKEIKRVDSGRKR
jgi:hypothetical protein